MNTEEQKQVIHVSRLILQYFFSYIKYFFLTISVVIYTVIILFMVMAINPDVSFEFLKVFAFLDPKYAEGNFSLEISDLMKLFSVVTLFFWFITSAIRFVSKKYFNREVFIKEFISNKKKYMIFFTSYILFAIAVFLKGGFDVGFFFIFVVFGFIHLTSLSMYLLFKKLSKGVSSSAKI
ncbi:hypothetical protein KKG22_05355 [Patescibacteria group bacterium]|nr:hypothetical protein [Patescibacteria group bacterium]MBU1721551.1 hypothetical protein [Patescibacteria group bacterium]MBU1901471.1 hypothetical protein [Patescibacteria group bacterium]